MRARFHPIAWLVASLAISTGFSPASAYPSRVSVTPDPASWAEATAAVIEGMGCTPHAGAPQVDFTGAAVTIALQDDCPQATDPAPYSLSVPLDLAPGKHSLQVTDAHGTSVSASWTTYDVARIALDLPPVVSAANPDPVRVSGYASCPSAYGAVDGRVIAVHWSDSCNVLPPAPAIYSFDIPLTPLAPGDYEVRAFDDSSYLANWTPALVKKTLHVRSPERCLGRDDMALCLQDGRFSITVAWSDYAHRLGIGHALPLAGSDESGLFWFFGPDKTELTVKVLDGCKLNSRFWVFVSSSSTVEYAVTVRDTVTHATRTYANALGHAPALVADTDSFGGCS